MRVGYLLCGLWNLPVCERAVSCAASAASKKYQNGTCFHTVFRGCRSYERTLSEAASRIVALCDLDRLG